MTRTLRGVSILAALLLLSVMTGSRGNAAAVAGTKITNQATATYENVKGTTFGSSSNTVTVLVAEVAALTIGPQDPGCSLASDIVATGGSFSRKFTVTNASNGVDAYQVTAATATAGTVSSIAFVAADGTSTPTTAGGSKSTPVAPAGTIAVSVTVNDAGVAGGTKDVVTLTVRTTASSSNGQVSATAQQCGLLTSPAQLSGAFGPGTAIAKTVNGVAAVQASGGAIVTYDVKFKNTGGSIAPNVVLTDPVPAGITPKASSVTVNGVSAANASHVSGNTLTVDIGNVAIGATEDESFTATVSSSATLGSSLVNTATITADGLKPDLTNPAAVFMGTADVVYDGDVGASAPISGAVVTVSTDGAGGTKAKAEITGTPVAPNTSGKNPYTTGASGVYAFGIAVPKTTTLYALTVTAPGYITRRLQLKLVPDATDTLYQVTMSSLDGAPLGVAGGFTLVVGPIEIAATYGLFGNIPMFKPQAVSVTKVVDRATASGGSRLVYTLTAANGTDALGATTVEDDLPAAVAYADHTARVDGEAVEPAVNGSKLTWSFPALTKQHTIVFAAVVLPNVSDGATLVNQVVVRAAIPGSATFFATGRAQAQTIVVPGIFSDRIPITGRVFLDNAGTGRFTKGDAGVGGVRVWLEDGESVVTDAAGRYDFPATRPGMHVLHVDQDTLPRGVTFFPTHAYDNERSSIQLVHGPFDGGLLQDVNFALRPAPGPGVRS